MSDIKFWDPIDDNNQQPTPDGWPEGQPAGTVNDCGRAVMGAVRRQWEDHGWFDFNDTVTFVATDQLNIAGSDLAERYHEKRRVRVTGTLTGTVYGTITGTSGNYVITVDIDAGAVFAADSDLVIAVGQPANNPTVDVTGLANLPPGIPVGSGMEYWGGSEPDATWMFADGRPLDASVATGDPTLQPLFDAIGNTYGGTDNTDFRLPDMRGRVAAGKDDMGTEGPAGLLTDPAPLGGGIVGNNLGNTGGNETHVLDVTELASHSHGGVVTATGIGQTGGTAAVIQNFGGSTAAQGQGQAHNIVQPTIIANYIIKVRSSLG